MSYLQPVTHYSLHFFFPLLIAVIFFRQEWKKAYFLLLLTMLVDLDHLIATPVFDPHRCSVGYHYFHTVQAIGCYFILLFLSKPYRILGIGLLLHMLTDFIDCSFMFNKCQSCLSETPAYFVLEFVWGMINM